MQVFILIISILTTLFSIAFGLFLYFKPALAIEIQKKFYLLINWRVEPVSLTKEIRNMKIMGLFLLIASVVAMAFLIKK